MEITLQKIEQVRERSGLTYTEARELLEEANGDVVQALVILENEESNGELEMTKMKGLVSRNVVEPMKRALTKSSHMRLRVKNAQGTLLEIPVTLGIAGAVFAPRMTAMGTLAFLLAQYSLEVDAPPYTPGNGVEWS